MVHVLATDDTEAQSILRQLGQAVAGRRDRIHDQRGAMLEMRAARPSGTAHIGEVDVLVDAQPGVVATCQRRQCFW